MRPEDETADKFAGILGALLRMIKAIIIRRTAVPGWLFDHFFILARCRFDVFDQIVLVGEP